MVNGVKLSRRIKLLSGFALFAAGISLLFPPLYSEVIQTNIQSGEQQKQAQELSKVLETKKPGKPSVHDSFAVIYIPRFGTEFRRPIAEGTSVKEVLDTVGIGHYLGTAMPNEVGNFALASHRTTHGGAFNNIDKLVEGDQIYVEFEQGWTTYEVVKSSVVAPNDTWVIGANPLKRSEDKWITLTTCTPRYTTEKRLIVWGKQTEFRSREDGPPAGIEVMTR